MKYIFCTAACCDLCDEISFVLLCACDLCDEISFVLLRAVICVMKYNLYCCVL